MMDQRLIPTAGLLAVGLIAAGIGAASAGSPATVAPPEQAVPTSTATAQKPKPASKTLTVVGKVTRTGTRTRVLVVGNDGSSASAPVARNGRFVVRVRSASVRNRLMPRRGTGPTLHLVRGGKYLGPVLLGHNAKALVKSRRGYVRLRAGLTGTVVIGSFTWNSKGFATPVRKPKAALVSPAKAVRLVRGVPIGAGTQGATGRLKQASTTRAWSRVHAAELPAADATLGADADTDGVPNLADVDMNGDQVLDAAQADSNVGGVLSGNEVFTGRPRSAITFWKILNMDEQRSVNSNKNPAVTWADLTQSIKENVQIEAIITEPDIIGAVCGDGVFEPCAAAEQVRSVTMNCGTLPYCQPGSAATIIASPGTGLDGKPLSDLSISPGLLKVPLDSHVAPGPPLQQGFQLAFHPNVETSAELQFAGDSFEFAFLDAAGNELARKAKVLTSSVATAAEWATVGGQPVVPGWRTPLRMADYNAVRAEFYRPQMLPAGSSAAEKPPLADRGGLAYQVYLISSDTNEFYICRPQQVTSADPDLAVLPTQTQWDPNLYDKNVTPPQGDTLAFTLDVNACLNDPAEPVTRKPAKDSWMTLEMESQDADGNRTRSRALMYAP